MLILYFNLNNEKCHIKRIKTYNITTLKKHIKSLLHQEYWKQDVQMATQVDIIIVNYKWDIISERYHGSLQRLYCMVTSRTNLCWRNAFWNNPCWKILSLEQRKSLLVTKSTKTKRNIDWIGKTDRKIKEIKRKLQKLQLLLSLYAQLQLERE